MTYSVLKLQCVQRVVEGNKEMQTPDLLVHLEPSITSTMLGEDDRLSF